MDGFMGTHAHRVDSKGRISIPASFRAVLRNGADNDAVTLIVRPSHLRPCLEGWPVAEFATLRAQLERADPLSVEYEELASRIYAKAQKLESDREGRIILPERLAKFAGIKEAVTFIGAGPTFRIWDTAVAPE
jgi:MraZ protein